MSSGREFMSGANCEGSQAHQKIIQREANNNQLDEDTLVAARVKCMVCAVFSECLDYGLSIPEDYGMYAGLTQRQRQTYGRKV